MRRWCVVFDELMVRWRESFSGDNENKESLRARRRCESCEWSDRWTILVLKRARMVSHFDSKVLVVSASTVKSTIGSNDCGEEMRVSSKHAT